jgi:hypothetical protein
LEICQNVSNDRFASVKEFLGPIIYTAHDLTFNVKASRWLTELVNNVISKEADRDAEIQAMKWVFFLRRALRHNCFPLLMEDGSLMYNPIRILVDGVSQCGQTARLVCDGLNAVGIPSRVLQLNGHVTAEFFAMNRWIIAEADILENHDNLYNKENKLASLEDIISDPRILTTVTPMPTQGPNCKHISPEEWRKEADTDWIAAFTPI